MNIHGGQADGIAIPMAAAVCNLKHRKLRLRVQLQMCMGDARSGIYMFMK